MQNLEITKTEAGFHIEGFPNAVKVLKIDSAKGKRLSDLALHKVDLEFALDCLSSINDIPKENFVVRQALWRSAVVHYLKCFGSSNSRFSLDANSIYKSDKGAFEPYEYFCSLRNKHLVHDENSYAQSIPGAVLNKEDHDYKIERIITLAVLAESLCQANWANLQKLTEIALEWVTEQYNKLCEILTQDLEEKPYRELFEMEGIVYSVPKTDEIGSQR